ncbi:unnamed protein product [Gemmata massiliana]|uniref:Lipoprotein n=1 Tax=Gemmata massiliana TaxID=1210884 RepID=A0A6P2CYR5_9BACT|nr:hypothetical protein [Gemmata massiliana]VTR94278.1 unnamed protein product [Gemmata massiliana]
MKRFVLCAPLALLTGCTNAPIAGFLDNCFPSRAKSDSPPSVAPDPRPGGSSAPPAPGPKPDKPFPDPDFGTLPKGN